jgi:ABC-2 type transport system ATP-binding protein
MTDLDQVCSRVVMISRGHLHFDGDIRDFKNRFGGEVQLKVTFMQNGIELQHKHLQVVTDEGLIKTICFHKNDITLQEAMATITGRYQVADISVTEADIEQIVKDIYQKNHQTDAS